jgi:hypothetical protein
MVTEKQTATDKKSVERNGDVKKAAVMKIMHITVKLPEDVHRNLKAKSALEGESTGNVLKRLIHQYIDG